MGIRTEQFGGFAIRHPEWWVDWPNIDDPEELEQELRDTLEARLETITDVIGKSVSAQNLCAAALIQWLLGDKKNTAAADEFWAQAKARKDFTRTTENEPARELAYFCIEANAPGLALRLLRRVASTLHEEPLERQAYTASIVANLVFFADEDLCRVFAGEADQLWQAAAAAGESVDDFLVGANRNILSREPWSYARPTVIRPDEGNVGDVSNYL